MSSALALSPATIAAVRPPAHHCLSPSSASAGPMALKSSILAPSSLSASHGRCRCKCASGISSWRKSPRTKKIRCNVAVVAEGEIMAAEKAKVGARVRVTVPLKVYHVVRVPEVELTGMEGVIKDYVAVWKGKRISANLPYKVEFVKEIEGRGLVKFFAHLKEGEFEFIDQ